MRWIFTSMLFLSLSAFAWKPGKIPSATELKSKLTALQYQVTQQEGTEPPFKNEYWNNHEAGIYVDLVSGEPLFSSLDKYDSGTGWPSFTRSLVPENIVFKEDRGLLSVRTEVRSKHGNSHLGHVFDDGPAPTGKRFCMNSAAMKFIPKDQMKALGYEEWLPQFNSQETTSKQTAIFAAGCFWCIQSPFDKLKGQGVIATRVGYTGGTKENPTYEQVSSGSTGHIESIEVTFDPQKISYEKLLQVFWKNIDPYDSRGQFCDKGEQYLSAIFYTDDVQKANFEKSKSELIKSGKLKNEIATKALPFKKFYPAEEYHQSYYEKNPIRYNYYRSRCGRDSRLKEVWGSSDH